MDNFVCLVKTHKPKPFSIGNAGMVNDIRTLTAVCEYCNEHIELKYPHYPNTKIDPALTQWRIRVFLAS